MKQETQLDLLQTLHDKLTSLAKSKGADYANEDVLSNFKKVSTIVKLMDIDATTPTGYALLMVVLKLVRIGNLKAKGENPKHESVIDSFEDGINYFRLAYLCEKELE